MQRKDVKDIQRLDEFHKVFLVWWKGMLQIPWGQNLQYCLH